MKIVATIKQALDPTGFVVNRKREKVFINREEYIINPADLNALELALRLQDQTPLIEVIALSLGPHRVEDAVREAMARGADGGVHILPTDDQVDAVATVQLLAAAIQKIGEVSLVVCGAVALDRGGGEIPGRLGEVLGWPILHGVCAIEHLGHAVVQVIQRTQRREHLLYEVDLPAILAVPTGVNRPRHIHGARVIDAYQHWDMITWTPADLGFTPKDLEPLTTSSGRRFPPERNLGSILEGTTGEAVAALQKQLRIRALVQHGREE